MSHQMSPRFNPSPRFKPWAMDYRNWEETVLTVLKNQIT